MKTAFAATVLGFAAIFASAAPVDEMKRRAVPTGGYAAPTGVSSYAPYPTGTATAPAYPAYTGLPTCSTNGALVCKGSTQFGICNWGHVAFQPVAAGTECVDGKIEYAA
ncbi:hypothetical protein LTR37_015668 [Vermiconidia calcicola]|uniref:Uncharacterized protein n=1 Tax=Vermiconidia calcicola TaxID=1690605 RepID=A0ACC3MR57_9PEZI|nr:hypothetical protein LTR37_015668 [Vermiconidia calcicola]